MQASQQLAALLTHALPSRGARHSAVVRFVPQRVRPVAVGEPLPEMPLFLEPNACVQVPLEATYQTAFAVMPRRWRRVLEPQT